MTVTINYDSKKIGKVLIIAGFIFMNYAMIWNLHTVFSMAFDNVGYSNWCYKDFFDRTRTECFDMPSNAFWTLGVAFSIMFSIIGWGAIFNSLNKKHHWIELRDTQEFKHGLQNCNSVKEKKD